jgi:ADP-ribose pyrophosphatase
MKPTEKKETRPIILHEGDFLRLIREGEWEYIERNNCRGIVIILAMTDDEKVILVEQYRQPVHKRVIEFPAGLICDDPKHKKESLVTAARRELLEETGYKAGKIVKLLCGPVSSGSSADLVTLVRADGLRKVARGGGDHTENIVVHEVPLAKAEHWLKQMARKGCLIEPKVYTGLFFLTKAARR